MNWKKWKDKLKNVYRFQIIDEKSYDVKLVLELSRLNILVGIGLLLAIFTVINFFFIAFTPLKQYIPGYGSSAGRKEVMNVSVKAEQLEDKLDAQQEYITNLQDILNDNITLPDTSKPKIKKAKLAKELFCVTGKICVFKTAILFLYVVCISASKSKCKFSCRMCRFKGLKIRL